MFPVRCQENSYSMLLPVTSLCFHGNLLCTYIHSSQIKIPKKKKLKKLKNVKF